MSPGIPKIQPAMRNAFTVLNTMPISIMVIGVVLFPLIRSGNMNERWK